MAQGRNKKLLSKRVKKGNKGYPVATVAFYGPDNTKASKVVCGIIQIDGAEAEPMKKWFTEDDARKSETIISDVLSFIDENGVKTVAMAESIMGCPHEEGVDYPEGESCPKCPFWKDRDRFTHKKVH